MEESPTGSVPVNHLFSRRRSIGRNHSVIQSLFCREYGFPHYARGAECVSSFFNEKSIGRRLIISRNPREEDEEIQAKSPYWPYSMTLGSTPSSLGSDRKRWIKVEIGKNCKLRFVDGVFWENQVKAQEGQRQLWENNDRFYILPGDIRNGFKFCRETKCPGPVKLTVSSTTKFHEDFYWDGKMRRLSSHLIILTKTGLVRLVDLLNPERSCEMQLPHQVLEPTNFTKLDLDVDDSTDEIFVGAKYQGKLMAVFCLNYLNDRLILKSVTNFSFPVKLNFFDGMITLVESTNCEDILCWKLLLNPKVTCKHSSYSSDSGTGVDFYEPIVNEKPTTLTRIPMKLMGFGSKLWEPHVYGRRKTETQIRQLATLKVIWERPDAPNRPTKMISFPDHSPRFLFLNGVNYEVVSLKRNADESVEAESSQPFGVPENQRRNIPAQPSRVTYARASKRKSESPSTEVFGMSLCSEFGLLAVCSEKLGNDDRFYVAIYRTEDLKLLKMVTPILQVKNVNKRGSIKGFHVDFTTALIVIIIDYEDPVYQDCFVIQLF